MADILQFPTSKGDKTIGAEKISTSLVGENGLFRGVMIAPAHNEEETIRGFLEQWRKEIPEMPLILVLDRCTDGTLRIVEEFAGELGEKKSGIPYFFRFISLRFNPYGKAGACLSGLWDAVSLQVGMQWPVLFWDTDREYTIRRHQVESLLYWLNRQGGLVSASREGKRLLRSRLAQVATKTALWLGTKKKELPNDVLTAVHGMPLGPMLFAMSGARSFDMETRLVHFALKHDLPIREEFVAYTPRVKGKKIRAYHLFGILAAAMGWR